MRIIGNRARTAPRAQRGRGRRDSGVRGRPDGDVAERELELGVIEQRAGGGPAFRCELDIAVVGPIRQDAEHGGEAVERVEAVEAARGDEGEDRGRCLRVDCSPTCGGSCRGPTRRRERSRQDRDTRPQCDAHPAKI